MGTSALVAVCLTGAALAGESGRSTGDDARPLLIAQNDTRAFNIPAQPLASALTLFGDQAGLQVTVDTAILEGLTARPVSGRMAPEEALRQLLTGSGLTWRFADPTTIVLSRAAAGDSSALTLDPVRVEGDGSEQSAWQSPPGYVAKETMTGTKTDTPLIEVPQSVSVITRDQMDARAATSVTEALRYSAGVQTDAYGIDTRGEGFSIRGFDETLSGQFRDGLRFPLSGGYSRWRIEPYALERVEVLRGPASALYGQNDVGGLVNLVSKRPTEVPLYDVELQAGNYDRFQGAFDLGGPVDEEGEWLYRLTGVGRVSDTQVDFVEDDRLFIAPALTWRPTEDTTITILTDLQRDETGDAGNFLPFEGTLFPNPNGKIPTNRFIGEPGFDSYDQTRYGVGYLFEQRIGEGWTLRQNLRYDHLDLDYKAVCCGFLLSDLRTLDRISLISDVDLDAFSVDNQVQSEFITGPLAHTLLFGLDYQRSSIDIGQGYGTAPPLDIFDPVYGLPMAPPEISILTDQTTDQIGLYLQDQIKLYDSLILVLGGRQDWAWTDTDDRISGTTAKQRDSDFTYRVGLVYLTEIGLAPYASYARSFQPTAGTDAYGTAFKPTTGQQYEVGVKYQPEGINSFITLSAFDLRKQNVLTADPNDPFNEIQTGEIRSRGIELEGVASLAVGLDLIGSYSYTDAEITKSNYGDEGNRPATVPKHMAALWADYTIPTGELAGLGFGGGVRYIGSTLDPSNTIKVPDYALVDAAIHYRWRNFRLALNVTNLLDKEYVSACDYWCYYGNRRAIIGTLGISW